MDAGERRPFHVEVPQESRDALHRRIAATRWPIEELVADRSQGVHSGRCRSSLATGQQTTTGGGPKRS
jgi:hypothetical protein